MRWKLKGWILACSMALAGMAGADSEPDEVIGTYDIRDGRPVVVAERKYRVVRLTKIYDRDGESISREAIPLGREVRIDKATPGLSGNAPIALRMVVLEPH